MIIQTGLGTPTNMEARIDMRFRPLHDLAKLIPILDLLERHFFYGRPCDDHPIKFLILDLIERLIKLS